MNVRRLAALDAALHGRKLVLAEFGCGAAVPLLLGILCLTRGRAFWQIPFGWYLVGIGFNYIPLLLHALTLGPQDQTALGTGPELRDQAARYGPRSLLLLVPLVVPILALVQVLHSPRADKPE
ncbi:hypothetical protein DYQ86_14860 [Acidobacteria bacterium AB60]|nr:hypothetical protein DYQ86_14860 [Acidobacteria bacterium AB60]